MPPPIGGPTVADFKTMAERFCANLDGYRDLITGRFHFIGRLNPAASTSGLP